MKLRALLWTTIALVAVSAIVGAALYSRLPDRVPTHFDMHGRPDGFTSKPIAVLVDPVALALLGLMFLVLPAIAPKGYRLEPFLRVYEIIAIAALTMIFADLMLALWFALGHRIDVGRALTLSLGLLFIVIGNYLGKVTRNFFVGIRTPWTLASEEVWLRTHRVGGPLFVAGGAVIVIASLAGTTSALVVTIPVIVGLALFLTVYSYVLYRRIEG
ncbi:MAG TPA: SdpI family protein [Thermoanaerobaculia bacterium]|nr:SdpI family protein [Thermoanaerobaculia bacterium]